MPKFSRPRQRTAASPPEGQSFSVAADKAQSRAQRLVHCLGQQRADARQADHRQRIEQEGGQFGQADQQRLARTGGYSMTEIERLEAIIRQCCLGCERSSARRWGTTGSLVATTRFRCCGRATRSCSRVQIACDVACRPLFDQCLAHGGAGHRHRGCARVHQRLVSAEELKRGATQGPVTHALVFRPRHDARRAWRLAAFPESWAGSRKAVGLCDGADQRCSRDVRDATLPLRCRRTVARAFAHQRQRR